MSAAFRSLLVTWRHRRPNRRFTLYSALGFSLAVHAAVLSLRLVDPQRFERLFRNSPLEVVLVNARSEEAPAIVEQAIQIKAAVVWMQEGIIHEQAADRARHSEVDDTGHPAGAHQDVLGRHVAMDDLERRPVEVRGVVRSPEPAKGADHDGDRDRERHEVA